MLLRLGFGASMLMSNQKQPSANACYVACIGTLHEGPPLPASLLLSLHAYIIYLTPHNCIILTFSYHEQQGLPPLLPKIEAILVLDGDGNRLAGKYYGDFLTSLASASSRTVAASSEETKSKSTTVEDLRAAFERNVQSKVVGIAARPDAAEVVTVNGRTCVFCGGTNPHGGGGQGDVRVVHVGPPNESELVLAHLAEGMYGALSHLMGGATDRTMVLDNLELVFLLIDEHCDGGIILETDPSKLASSVLLRDDEGRGMQSEHDMMMGGGGGGGGMPMGSQAQGGGGAPPGAVSAAAMMGSDMTLGQAFRQARDQLITGLAQRDGM